MRAVFVLLAACQQTTPVESTGSNAPPPARDARVAGPYVITYDCQHSNAPFGRGGQYNKRAWDLGARTHTVVTNTWTDDKFADAMPETGVMQLTPDKVARLASAVDKVLAGGPYKPEYPVPEGAPCRLAIAANGKQLFVIDKAYTKEPDAVTALVQEF